MVDDFRFLTLVGTKVVGTKEERVCKGTGLVVGRLGTYLAQSRGGFYRT